MGLDFIGYFISGFIGVVIGVLFDEPLHSIKRKVCHWSIYLFKKKEKILPPMEFELGSLKTSYIVIDGNGRFEYTPQTLTCRYEDRPISLPPEIIQLRKKIEKEENERKAQGLYPKWNGPLYALERYAISRTTKDENMELTLSLRPTDHFTFRATVLSLDTLLTDSSGKFTLRERYLENHYPSESIPFLATGIGINVAIITEDEKILFAERDKSVRCRANELDGSIAEGVDPVQDHAIDRPGPDFYRTVARGVEEEIGIEISQSDIKLLGFGVDMEYYQWNIIGVVYVNKKAKNILKGRTRGTKGKWENRIVHAIDSDPLTVFKFLKDKKIWSTGIVTIYWALVHKYGKKKVEDSIQKIFV